MNRNSNTYTFIYAALLVVVVAAVLALVSEVLKPRQISNIQTEKRLYILRAANLAKDAYSVADRNTYVADEYAKAVKNSYIVNGLGRKVEGDAFAVDMKGQTPLLKAGELENLRLPVFECTTTDGTILYVLSVYGAGLWGPIWGYIALESDRNTIAGAVFDHKSETPGLGAEISTDAFRNRFVGKTIFGNNEFVSIKVTKGGSGISLKLGSSDDSQSHSVDAISGGTMTSRGVENMLKVCLEGYLPFLKSFQIE